MSNIIAIGDLHCPFEHRDAFNFVTAAADLYQPDHVINIGDEVDSHGLGRWTHDPDGFSPNDEHAYALEHLRKWYDFFPDTMVCTSNHTARVYKKSFEAGIPSRFIKSYKEIMEAPEGWNWRDSWEIDDVLFVHGEGFSGMYAHRRMALSNGKSTVIGHTHANAGIAHINTQFKDYWGMNIGCLIDEEAYAFKYAKHLASRPSIGVGVIEGGVPIWIPMKKNKSGKRWTGEL